MCTGTLITKASSLFFLKKKINLVSYIRAVPRNFQNVNYEVDSLVLPLLLLLAASKNIGNRPASRPFSFQTEYNVRVQSYAIPDGSGENVIP